MMRKRMFVVLIVVMMLVIGGCSLSKPKSENEAGVTPGSHEGQQDHKKQELTKVNSVDKLQESYDLIVVGTDPEGISAAVSGARNGLKTLLVDGRDREILGGLMTIGWLNSIDMNWVKPKKSLSGKEQAHLNQGIFTEWYKQVEGHSFDVTTAANVFNKLVSAEGNIDIYMKSEAIEPIIKKGDHSVLIEGVAITDKDGKKHNILAKAVIDATQDADIAAAAGVSFTIGREDLGDKESSMAVTAVFRLKNIDDKAWNLITKRLSEDGDEGTGSDQMSAWGYGKEMKAYVPLNKERAMMRGLNIGRQNDDTILINALHIFEIDGLDPDSHKEALEIAKEELPNVVKFLNKLPEFKHAELDAIATELYVRETRHMKGLYRLSILDLLENRDQWDRIAFGSYPADIQKTSPSDSGAIPVDPQRYAVPFRSIVPQHVDGLLVVGRAASYDTLAHGSARVIPTGMAEGQAAGAVVKLVADKKITFRQLAENKSFIAELQKQLTDQGMELKEYTLKPQSFMEHKSYPGLKAAVYMGLAYGSYGNTAFNLDEASNAQRMVNQVSGMGRMHPTFFEGDIAAALQNVTEPAKTPLTLQQASFTFAKALDVDTTIEEAQAKLQEKGFLSKATIDGIKNKQKLTNGDAFMMLKDMAESVAGAKFE
ncbi:FAD-dependent oxidoreductase [Paenibacillus eucommiae]|uniref:Component of type VI protein secretion system n=1 Tax=Paenibacillus eucommiae TaxID=1355755 RepID=A0ABS4JB57_9BACL|nr:FAD-dependent oxidoreductase [Paenibacillus eucommiae]MBP1997087.1 putative component of type VI protein secretion system [Paenibacillus eucommiae]